ncbi:MAG: glycosyltransferase family 4 protein [Treponema sp.]|nr:glycosyltransferase family 4 protein [Treponema sp.]
MSKEIIFIVQQLESGGLEKAVITLANALSERNDYNVNLYIILHSKPIVPIAEKITVVFLTKRKLNEEIKIECCSHKQIELNILCRLIRKVKRFFHKQVELNAVRKLIRKTRNSIVISTRNEYSTIISKNTDKSNFIIAQLHNDYSKEELNDFVTKYQHINVFVQLNETFKKEIESALRKKNSFTKVIVIPNFIDQQNYVEEKRENYVIAVGRFSRIKGFDRLITIWEMICKEITDWKLLIIGDGNEFENIKNLVIEKNLNANVELLGRLDNNEVFRYMRKSKIYTLTSYSESFSLVTLEAMQNKLPVVAFDVRTGPRNIIKNTETGYLVKDGNIDAYSEKIMFLMKNEGIRQKMGMSAFAHSNNFLKENVMKKWYELIDSRDSERKQNIKLTQKLDWGGYNSIIYAAPLSRRAA